MTDKHPQSATIGEIFEDRQADYPLPLESFMLMAEMSDAFDSLRKKYRAENPGRRRDMEAALQKVVEMIILKFTRLAKNPAHYDSWVDIGGYAQCAVSILQQNAAEEAYDD